jgi:integrase
MSGQRGEEKEVRGGVVTGDLRVQAVNRKDRARSYTIVWPDGSLHGDADEFLRCHEGSGTQRTYAYVLVDHLRWMQRERLTVPEVELRDLERYMGLQGAEVRMPLGEPWRAGKRPFGPDALSTTAACLKGFYLHHTTSTVNPVLRKALSQTRLPSRADRRRAFLGHTRQTMPANPLAPARGRRRHPKMLPDDARQRLLNVVRAARDRMVVTWLADAGLRIGELCGLHMVDLHLRENAGCGECRSPHVHVCDRPANANEARAKTKHPWWSENSVVRGGLIKRVSPAMVHTYFDYVTTEYPRVTGHGMLLVQLHGEGYGLPWTPVAARRMLHRAGHRAGLGLIRPHQFRHIISA